MMHAQISTEIDYLREENRQLKEMLATSYPLPCEWCLSAMQVRGMQALLAADAICWERLALAAYGSDYPPKTTINAFVFGLRRKMQPFDMQIISLWQFGYTVKDRKKWIEKIQTKV